MHMIFSVLSLLTTSLLFELFWFSELVEEWLNHAVQKKEEWINHDSYLRSASLFEVVSGNLRQRLFR